MEETFKQVGNKKLRVAIAGCTGFVGKALAKELGEHFEVIGLARNPPDSPGEGVFEWRKTDFFSLLDAEAGLAGAEIAYYLVHSMMPAARLTQGRFQDFDLLAADNFARAAKKNGVKQIIYLGGLIPPNETLSTHLGSRLEVEHVLSSYGVPLTTLRASLIVGAEGSSFIMLSRLVERLPIMVCPGWTKVETQPIEIGDVIKLLAFCAGHPKTLAQTFDIGGPEILTYEKMILETSKALGRKTHIIPFPLFSPGLSRLWISLITGAPASFVRPLLQSLRHRMVTRDRRLQEMAGISGTSFQSVVHKAIGEKNNQNSISEPLAFLGSKRIQKNCDVTSIQRLQMPKGYDATQVAQEYLRWLPAFFAFLIRVTVTEEAQCTFYLWPFKTPLLAFSYSPTRSQANRALFYINGGILAKIQGRGRLEFREVLGGKYLITAVHEFRPSLPWIIYKFTQAIAHRLVMWAFGRHLKRLSPPQ